MFRYTFSGEGLTKKYRKFTALDNISFSISEGEIFGLIGENGAGKTTLMKIIAGSTSPTSGTMELMGAEGRDLQKKRREMGVLIENPACYSDMTGWENLEIIRIAKDIRDKNAVNNALQDVGLLEVKNKKAGKYSLGMKQRLGLAMALLGNPKFLILDEPINGLDPNGILNMREIICRLNREKGITLLISSHILTELSQVATQYGILHKGRIIALHSAVQLQEQCERYINIFHTDNTQKIINFLSQYDAEIAVATPQLIKVKYAANLPTNLLVLLVKANFNLTEYQNVQETLEEYFVRLTKNEVKIDV